MEYFLLGLAIPIVTGVIHTQHPVLGLVFSGGFYFEMSVLSLDLALDYDIPLYPTAPVLCVCDNGLCCWSRSSASPSLCSAFGFIFATG